MPDSNGNLLGIEDFKTGLRIRLHSYLNPDIVLAAGYGVTPSAWVHHWAEGPAQQQTVFTVQAMPNEAFSLYLRNIPGTEDLKLMWWSRPHNGGVDIITGGVSVDYRDAEIFTIDRLESPWFALNNHDRTRVVDVQESKWDSGTPIIGFKWNGGENQRWRAQIVPPGRFS